ncbi:unnamed protein product [Phytomonas sp. EM1]|nr:unnamed protein product [Phytomonas sp. EM1]|eukprot:CCW62622.1 unnamed protein product [Phytomonas sp. isolate EM1]
MSLPFTQPGVDLTSKKPFVLRADGWFHTSDVRAVAALPGCDDFILSASRDATAALLQVPPVTKDDLVAYRTFIGHTEFVNFIFFHPGLKLIGGYSCIVSGSNDHHVVVWDSETAGVRAVLDGHAQGVCHGTFVGATNAANGGVDPSHGDIVTGDWAGVCHVFDHTSGRIKLSYTKHATAIRGLAHLPTTRLVVSASGDKTIHAWDVHTGLTRRVFRGHADVVQCVCAINASLFASGSNDCTVRLWKIDQDAALCVLQGHDSIIYSLIYSTLTDEMYSASEDHTVRVWSVTAAVRGKDSSDRISKSSRYSPVEVIYHPCVVWGLAALQTTGDIVTGGSDGCVRIWTRNDALIANPEKIELLNAAISAQTVDIKLTELDTGAAGGSNALDNVKVVPIDTIYNRRGSYEGEKLFVKDEDGQVVVYMWGKKNWDKVGTVVAGPDQSAYTGEPVARERKIHQGKSYDYLFDVEVEGRMLKLGYNVGDNILETAQRFINEHSGIVSQDSREEIQNFLLANISPGDLRQTLDIGKGGSAPSTTGALPRVDPTRSCEENDPEARSEALNVSVTPYTCPEVFSKFNARGAQHKINEYLHGTASSRLTSSPESFFHLMDNIQELHTLSNDGIRLFCKGLCELGQVLPEGCRFPLLDANRFLLYQLMTHSGSVTSISTAVGTLFDTFEALLMSSNAILTDEKAVMNDAETLVSLRLLCNALALLIKVPCDISHAHKASMVITTKSLSMLALQKLSNANIKSALVSLMVNTSLYLPAITAQQSSITEDAANVDSCADSYTTAQLAVLFVSVAAKFLVCEPVGSAHTLHVLRALYTLFHLDGSNQRKHQQHKAEHRSVWPMWLDDARKMGKTTLQYTLHSIETGSNLEARPIAKKIMTILSH